MCQSETDKMFVAALKDVRLGMCSSESGTFISQLARELALQLANNATQIFFQKECSSSLQSVSTPKITWRNVWL